MPDTKQISPYRTVRATLVVALRGCCKVDTDLFQKSLRSYLLQIAYYQVP